MKSLWNNFKVAFAMFSKIPMPRADWTKENMKYMFCFFPFIGTVIGGLTMLVEKAVKWNAKVILSVPCCQHELNRQIANKELYPIMDYGILKERMAALLTDGIRAKLLENAGYETQILEFIDMEHTPKNLLIRAVKRQEGSKKLPEELKVCMEAYHVKPTLADLLTEKEEP